jgi:formylglycine-generating enzyme required for sulfatase activity
MRHLVPAFAVLAAAVAAPGAQMPQGKEYTNFIGMKFVRIEPGTFRMGQLDDRLPPEVIPGGLAFLRTGDFDEKPVHEVTVTRPFYMGVCEVTNLQYELFDPSHRSLRGKGGLSRDDDEAVIYVNWYDAMRFCQWLGDKEGLVYRLATEAEWEYACRAGTKTNYYCGDTLAEVYRRNARRTGGPAPTPLHVAKTPPNPWGLYDMHGNVEEWCHDWYGPYVQGRQVDPVGYAAGDAKVTRGGSHGTQVYYLRSANRLGSAAGARNWITGFRVVIGPLAATRPPDRPVRRHQKGVVERGPREVATGPDPGRPYFKGPRKYVNIPTDMYGPVFKSHNHAPAIVACPNGDILTAWFSTVTEGGREMVTAAARLRRGEQEWEQASLFWDSPDRNEHATGLWRDEKGGIYHFAAPSFASSSKRIMTMRTSGDSGATWSGPRIVIHEYGPGRGCKGNVWRLRDGRIAAAADLRGGAGLWLGKDDGLNWYDPGGRIRGIHPGVVQLGDGRLLAFGRGGEIDGMMPKSVSTDLGKSWYYQASEFPPIGGQQKLALLKLAEGPLFFASFADRGTDVVDASGAKRRVRGLFCAASENGGQSWPYRRLITHDGPPRPVETTAGGLFVMSERNSEYRGYMAACQAQNGVIHLVTSRQHYAFNLAWLKTPQPAERHPHLAVEPAVETFDGPDRFDCENWADYHAYRGGFNGRGQYTVEALGPFGGINRIVGRGSFEMQIAVVNVEFFPCLHQDRPGFTLWLRDDRQRTLVFNITRRGIDLDLNDRTLNAAEAEAGLPKPAAGEKSVFASVPQSFNLRLLYDQGTGRIRVFYGVDGEPAAAEPAQSRAGIYFGEPLTESTAVFLMFSAGKMDLDHYVLKPR